MAMMMKKINGQMVKVNFLFFIFLGFFQLKRMQFAD